jgi:hypothetical protein
MVDIGLYSPNFTAFWRAVNVSGGSAGLKVQLPPIRRIDGYPFLRQFTGKARVLK